MPHPFKETKLANLATKVQSCATLKPDSLILREFPAAEVAKELHWLYSLHPILMIPHLPEMQWGEVHMRS